MLIIVIIEQGPVVLATGLDGRAVGFFSSPDLKAHKVSL